MVSKVLIVEDDAGLQKYLKEFFLDNQYSVQAAGDGIIALDLLSKTPSDLVVVDLGLPNMSGESLIKEIRKKYTQLPIIVLTARDGLSDIVEGFNIGADDYMTKPFQADELLARVKARLRKSGDVETKLKVSNLELDDKTMEVKRDKHTIQLTPQEFRLLEYLMRNKDRVLTREMILNRVWLYSQDIETRVVDVYMGYLRKKIDGPFTKKLLCSVRGFGYMIKE